MRSLLLMISISLTITGCVERAWVKDGATQQQFSADQFDCKQKAYTMVGGYNTVNNFGALTVHAPGFFTECMNSKGYHLQPVSSSQQPQQPVDTVAWLSTNMPHQGGAWMRRDMVRGTTLALEDYRTCLGHQQNASSETCMRTRGYGLIHFMQPSHTLNREAVTEEQRIDDRIACDSMDREEVLTCLRRKGWIETRKAS